MPIVDPEPTVWVDFLTESLMKPPEPDVPHSVRREGRVGITTNNSSRWFQFDGEGQNPSGLSNYFRIGGQAATLAVTQEGAYEVEPVEDQISGSGGIEGPRNWKIDKVTSSLEGQL